MSAETKEALSKLVGAIDDAMTTPGEVTEEQAEVVASAYVELKKMIAREEAVLN